MRALQIKKPPLLRVVYESGRFAGQPMAGGIVRVRTVATKEPARCFMDEAGEVLHPYPIILDSNGEALIYVDDDQVEITIDSPLGIVFDRLVFSNQ